MSNDCVISTACDCLIKAHTKFNLPTMFQNYDIDPFTPNINVLQSIISIKDDNIQK